MLGLRAQPALERILQDVDPEARSRAGRILRDFEYGILPSTPAQLRQNIAQFRDGDADVRARAFQGLIKDRSYETLENLISKQDDPKVRAMMLSQMFQDMQCRRGSYSVGACFQACRPRRCRSNSRLETIHSGIDHILNFDDDRACQSWQPGSCSTVR